MKTKQVVTLVPLILLLTFFSCMRRPAVDTKPAGPGDALFQKAEKSFGEREYDKALSLYNKYLGKYPKSPLAPAVILKTGLIFSATGNYKMARNTYKEIIRKYPDSNYTPDAMVEILTTYYNEGRYQEVIEKSYDIPEDLTPDDYILRKYAVVGDAFLAMDSPVLAFDAFLTAYAKASPSENTGILIKIRKAAAAMPDQELIRLSDSTEQEDVRGCLFFQRCLNSYNSGETYDALRLLDRFINMFPGHRLTDEARTVKKKLTSRDFDPFLIGCLLPTSGKYEAFGLKAQMGFDLAYDDFTRNASNPIIRVIYRDTSSDPEEARAAVRELAGLGVAAIVGPVGTINAATEEAQVRGIPIIALTGKSGIAETGDYIFRNFLTPAMQIQAVVSYAFEVLSLNSFAILYPDEEYGKKLMNLFWDEVLRYNGKIVGVESYKPGCTDFAEPIRKLTGMYYPAAKDPPETGSEAEPENHEDAEEKAPVVDFDGIFIPDTSAQVGLILPQLSFYDVGDICLLGTNIWHSRELIDRAGKYAGNAIIPDAFFPDSEDPAVQRFVRKFRDAFDSEPGFIEAVSYDSAMIIFNTIKSISAESPADIRDKMLTVRDYHGVTGLTGFDENGNAWKELYMLKVRGKKFVARPD